MSGAALDNRVGADKLEFAPATRERFADFARLFPELGVDDPLPTLEDWLARLAPDTVFAVRDGAVVGYGYAQALGADGYVRNVVTDPTQRGRGVGRALMLELRRRLAQSGCVRWQLNVKVDNAPALGLYHSLGLVGDFRTWVLRAPTASALALPASPRDASVRECGPELDAWLQAHFAIPPGLLARHRLKPDARVLVCERSGTRVGLAPFDPAFPGCFPFRLLDESCARAMLEPLLRLVPSGRPHLQLVLERDERAARLLLAAGVRLHFEIQHMHGPVA